MNSGLSISHFLSFLLLPFVPVFGILRERKWLENADRKDLTFPNPLFIQSDSSCLRCVASCAKEDDCDGITFSKSTMICRGHAINDVMDIDNGVASPDTKIWINADCRRIGFIYIDSLDWCVKITPMVIPTTRGAANKSCEVEQARLVNIDSKEKHDELGSRLLSLLPWWISGRVDGNGWKWDDGTPISTDPELWSALPVIPFVSTCLCYTNNQFWPCTCLGINGVICEEV